MWLQLRISVTQYPSDSGDTWVRSWIFFYPLCGEEWEFRYQQTCNSQLRSTAGFRFPDQELCSEELYWFCCMVTACRSFCSVQLKCMWFTSSQWGWSFSGSRMLQCGVQQCQNILKVWALANYFSRTQYSWLAPSVSAASTSLTHQNLPKAKLISFFCLFFFYFTLATEVKQTNMISLPSRQLMMAVWQHHGLEGDFPLTWLFSITPGTIFAELSQGIPEC